MAAAMAGHGVQSQLMGPPNVQTTLEDEQHVQGCNCTCRSKRVYTSRNSPYSESIHVARGIGKEFLHRLRSLLENACDDPQIGTTRVFWPLAIWFTLKRHSPNREKRHPTHQMGCNGTSPFLRSNILSAKSNWHLFFLEWTQHLQITSQVPPAADSRMSVVHCVIFPRTYTVLVEVKEFFLRTWLVAHQKTGR